MPRPLPASRAGWTTLAGRAPRGGAERGYCPVMSRLPYLRYADASADGQAVWDGIVGSRGGELVNADGGLIGPFNAFVHAPGAGRRLSSLGATLRFKTSIEPRLSELAILTVGAAWHAEFEWWAHARMAREHGISDAVIGAIGQGAEPPFDADDERAVYAVAHELTETAHLGPDAYAAAHGCSATRAWSSWLRSAATTRWSPIY